MSSVSVVRRVFVAAVLVAAAVAATPGSTAPVEPLVSAQWLKDHLRDPQIAVIDVRMGAPVYDAGHIPGAVHSDYDKAGWRVSRNGVLQLPNKAELEKLIGETGIDEDSHVIVVPAGVSATDFGAAARLLGRRWTLVGDVVTGDQLGRQIGFPTANLATNGLVLPPHGVYAGRVQVNGTSWKVALNIGVRPTVSQPAPQLRVEAHLIDFSGELVGQELEIELLERLRPEMKFASFNALRAQIAADVEAVRRLP